MWSVLCGSDKINDSFIILPLFSVQCSFSLAAQLSLQSNCKEIQDSCECLKERTWRLIKNSKRLREDKTFAKARQAKNLNYLFHRSCNG